MPAELRLTTAGIQDAANLFIVIDDNLELRGVELTSLCRLKMQCRTMTWSEHVGNDDDRRWHWLEKHRLISRYVDDWQTTAFHFPIRKTSFNFRQDGASLGGKNCHWRVHLHIVALLKRMFRPNITLLRREDQAMWMSR